MNIFSHGLTNSSAYAFSGALRGAVSSAGVRLVAPITAPSTGAVRPKAVDQVLMTRLVDGTSGTRVRTWSPPV